MQLRSLFCVTDPQQFVLVKALALRDRTLSHPLRSPCNYIHCCVPLSHSSWFRSKPSRSPPEPCPNQCVPLSRKTLFVVRAITLLTQTHSYWYLVDKLVSLRRSRLGTLTTTGLRLMARVSCGSPIVVKVADPTSHETHPNH